MSFKDDLRERIAESTSLLSEYMDELAYFFDPRHLEDNMRSFEEWKRSVSRDG